MLQTIGSLNVMSLWNPWNQLRATIASAKSLVLGAEVPGGAIQRTATYLVMSHDSNEIGATMKNDQFFFSGPAEGRSEHFTSVKAILSKSISRSCAQMGLSCHWCTFFSASICRANHCVGPHRAEVTVHPLGGANMSTNGTGLGGVVNHIGQVFTGNSSGVYDGLVCCDASIIPSALGM